MTTLYTDKGQQPTPGTNQLKRLTPGNELLWVKDLSVFSGKMLFYYFKIFSFYIFVINVRSTNRKKKLGEPTSICSHKRIKPSKLWSYLQNCIGQMNLC